MKDGKAIQISVSYCGEVAQSARYLDDSSPKQASYGVTLVRRFSNGKPPSARLNTDINTHIRILGGALTNARDILQRHTKTAQARSALVRRLAVEYKAGLSVEAIGAIVQRFEAANRETWRVNGFGKEDDSLKGSELHHSRQNQPTDTSAFRVSNEARAKTVLDHLASTPVLSGETAKVRRDVTTSSTIQSVLKELGENADPGRVGEAILKVAGGEYWPKGLGALTIMGRR